MLNHKSTLIKCKVVEYSLRESPNFFKSKYVEYSIIITTPIKGWQVFKRYSDFEALHNSLMKKLTNLPQFPPKVIASQSESVIQERMILFELYLNNLLLNHDLRNITELAEFISLDLSQFNTSQSNSKPNEPTLKKYNRSFLSMVGTVCNSKENVYTNIFQLQQFDADSKKSANILVIEEFLRNLDEKRDYKIDVIKDFEAFLKDSNKWPYFSTIEIDALYNGIHETEDGNYYNGLLYHTGNVHNNRLGAQKCLEFLSKLFSYDFNPQCEDYIAVFRQTAIDSILSMELETHLLSKGVTGQLSALIIMKSLLDDSLHLVKKTKRILNNEQAERIFLEWYKKGINDENDAIY